MGRKFVRMSLGGIHDEAEIRGHRRTYIGALPGRIIQSIKTAGTNNPVFMLDEVDKIGMDFRGDPSSALLEVLDPEQNNTFQDNYLEVPFDLSKVLFVATANLLDPIPPALRDRMEIVQLPGYTEQEKIEIGKRFLIPKQMTNHGLKAKHIEITDEAMTELVRSYTHEAGVRNLEREIANVMRKVARQVAEGRKRKTVIDPKKLADLLGPQRFEYGELESEDQTGAATGLVVTEVGGDVVAIEVTRMEGREDFILTGQLGEVMRESARAGLSWTRAHARELGIDREIFEKNTLHIHVPAGAIPKDGPSAGITMATAIVSALTGHPRPQGRGDDRRDHAARSGPADRRAQEQDPRRPPVGREDRHPPAQEREGPAGHPRGDPQVDQAHPRRQHGPGARGGPPAQAEGARRPSRRRSSRASEPARAEPEPPAVRRTNFPPTDQPPVVVRGHLASGTDWRRQRGRRTGSRVQGLLRRPRRAEDGVAGRHQEGLPQARPPAPPGRQARRQGRRAAVQGRQRGQRGPLRPRQAQAVRRARRELGGDQPGPSGRRRRRGAARSRASAGPAAATSATSSARPATPGEFSDFFRMFFGEDAGGVGRCDRPGSRPTPDRRPDLRRHPRRDGHRRATATAAARRARRRPDRPAKPAAEAVAEITLEEAFHGTTRLVEVDGKRLEVTIPRGRRHRHPRSG